MQKFRKQFKSWMNIRCISEKEIEAIRFYTRSIVSILGSIFFWLGIWNLLTERLSTRGVESDSQLFSSSGAREIAYCVIGISFLIATDTLYGNAGLRGGYFPPRSVYQTKTFIVGRCTFGLIGSALFWVGTYDWLERNSLEASLQRDISYGIVGLLSLFFTNTFLVMAFVYPPNCSQQLKPVVDFHSPLSAHIRTSLRCVISILGQNMVWLGCWNSLEYYFSTTVWRELFYSILGVFMFGITNHFNVHKRESSINVIEESEETDDKYTEFEGDLASAYSDTNSSIVFAVRAIAALLGQVVLTVGTWSLFDQYIFPQTQARDAVVVVIGLLMLYLSGALLESAAITPLVAAFYQPETGLDLAGPCDDVFPVDTSGIEPSTPALKRTQSSNSMFSGTAVRSLWSSHRARFHSSTRPPPSASQSPSRPPMVSVATSESSPLLGASPPIFDFKLPHAPTRRSGLAVHAYTQPPAAHPTFPPPHPCPAPNPLLHPTIHDPLLAPDTPVTGIGGSPLQRSPSMSKAPSLSSSQPQCSNLAPAPGTPPSSPRGPASPASPTGMQSMQRSPVLETRLDGL